MLPLSTLSEDPEVEGWKVKFLQLNLGRGKEAQNLLMPTANERGADVMLISEQHECFENSAWYQDASWRAEILIEEASHSLLDVSGFNAWVLVGNLNLDPEDEMTDRPPGSNCLFQGSV